MAAANGEPIPRQDAQQQERDEEDLDHEFASEDTPLLAAEDTHADQSQPQRERTAESLLRSFTSGSGNGTSKSVKRRWPSFLALVILCLVIILIMVFAFFAPSVVEQYASKAVQFEPTSLSIDGFTDTGVRARIQGDFSMDASRVSKKAVRDLGRFGTWIAREAESKESKVRVTLPEYGNVVLGTAHVPAIKVDIRNGHRTHVDFLSDLEPGNKDGIRSIANDWIDGRLGQLRVVGEATVPLKSGLFSFGSQNLRKELLFANKDVPSIPSYDISRIIFHENEGRGMAADVSLQVSNDYPIDFTVPPLGFQILMQDCIESDPYISVADAITKEIHVRSKQNVEVNVTGYVSKLPNMLTRDCPDSNQSPLDLFVGNYMRGQENTVYVRGAESPSHDTPQWVADLTKDILVPVPLPGKTAGDLIKNFSLEDTNFNLPDPFASPNTPERQPRISAKVKALVALPEEMNFNISADRVRADAEVFYKGGKLGNLDLNKWQKANSTQIQATKDSGPLLLVESLVKQAPLNITDEAVFTDVIQDLVFGGKSVVMDIKADVSVEVETALGEFKIRKIPAEGRVPVKPISGGDKAGASFRPKINDLQIINTTEHSLTLSALVSLTNPTEYAATVPYVDIHIVKNGSLLGHATARDLHLKPGVNDNLLVQAIYDPLSMGGPTAKEVGRQLLSQYITGLNTTLSLQMHNGSIPTQPALGKALSRFPVEIPTPKLKPPASDPNDPDAPTDEGPHFIKDAVVHLITSTASFTLMSPLRHSTIYVEDIDATAYYKGDDVGRIEYDLPFAVPPVDKQGNGVTSPRLPVDWSLGSVGYEAVKNALGGTLKLAAEANVTVRIDHFRETVWFKGKGIGASVRL